MKSETEKSFTDKIIEFQGQCLPYINGRVKYVYHYTSIEAMKSILENDNLWLSDSRFLNDKTELEDGRKATIEAINKLLNKSNNLDKSILEELLEYFKSDDLCVYVASFCTKSNLAHQWALYANKGQGVCIKYEINNDNGRKFFRLDNKSQPSYFRLYKVNYACSKDKAKMQETLIADFFRQFYSDISTTDKLRPIFVGYLKGFLARSLSVFKNESFAAEQEVRLVLDKYNAEESFEIKYRVRNNIIIPYVETNGLKDNTKELCGHYQLAPIKEILVAPVAYQDTVIRSIEILIKNLAEHGRSDREEFERKNEGKILKEIKVKTYDLPYRA